MPAVRYHYTSLFVRLTQATDRELGRMVRYLKEENRLLRARLPQRINITTRSGTDCSDSAGILALQSKT